MKKEDAIELLSSDENAVTFKIAADPWVGNGRKDGKENKNKVLQTAIAKLHYFDNDDFNKLKEIEKGLVAELKKLMVKKTMKERFCEFLEL